MFDHCTSEMQILQILKQLVGSTKKWTPNTFDSDSYVCLCYNG